MQTIEDMKVGDLVRCVSDATHGEIVAVDYVNIKIRWEDGKYSIVPKRDGFVLFVPRCLPPWWPDGPEEAA